MFSASLAPLQPGSWLISIFAGLGAVPSNFTVPLMVATVAGSIGVAAGAGWAGCSAALFDCSVFSFLLHAARANSAHSASMLRMFFANFRFMMSPFLWFALLSSFERAGADLTATRRILLRTNSTANLRSMLLVETHLEIACRAIVLTPACDCPLVAPTLFLRVASMRLPGAAPPV